MATSTFYSPADRDNAMLKAERIPLARPGLSSLTHWDRLDPHLAADLVRRDVLGGEVTLPLVWLFDGVVAPVVTWCPRSLALRGGRGPVLSRAVLQDRLEHGRHEAEPPVLAINGFVAVQPMTRAVSTLAWLSVFTAVAAAVPRPPGASTWDAFECDYRGFTVAEADAQGARAVVSGRAEGRGSTRVSHQWLLLHEQLFDVALRTGQVPATV